jgi:hypothetical protein
MSSDTSPVIVGEGRGLPRSRKILIAVIVVIMAFSVATARPIIWPAANAVPCQRAIVMPRWPG